MDLDIKVEVIKNKLNEFLLWHILFWGHSQQYPGITSVSTSEINLAGSGDANRVHDIKLG